MEDENIVPFVQSYPTNKKLQRFCRGWWYQRSMRNDIPGLIIKAKVKPDAVTSKLFVDLNVFDKWFESMKDVYGEEETQE